MASVSAFAQSSVSIYGTLDLGYSHITSTNGNANDTLAQTTASGIGNSAQSSSRLGFKGTEDLGGGSSAGFTFETGLSPAGNQSGQALSTFNNRQAFLTLANTDVGTVNVGLQYTPVHVMAAAYNLGGANNVVGDLAYTGNVAGTATGSSTALANTNLQAGTQSYTIRANNAVSYVLPASVGFTGAIAYFKSAADTQSLSASGTGTVAVAGKDASGYGLVASKEFGPFSVGGAYQQYKSKNFIATSSAVQSEIKQTEYTVGAKYIIGAATIGYQRVSNKGELTSGLSAAAAATAATTGAQGLSLIGGNYTRTIDQLALAYTFTPTVNAWISHGKGKVQQDIVSGWKADTSGTQLGANYVLSKRTNLYAIYGTQKLDVATNAQAKDTQYAMGIRHTF